MGLHGVEDREESFLATTLNIFFELRLASSIKPVPTAFAQWDVKKNTRQRKEKKKLDCKRGPNLLASIEERKKIWGGRQLWRKRKEFGERSGWEKGKTYLCDAISRVLKSEIRVLKF